MTSSSLHSMTSAAAGAELPPLTTAAATTAALSPSIAALSSSISPRLPRLPLPPRIYSNTPGTWAYDTMSRRVDGEILQRTYDENVATWQSPAFETLLARFQALRTELQTSAPLQHLEPPLPQPDDSSSELLALEWREWHDLLEPYVARGDTWLTAPWMITEFYVYRRLMQAVDYFVPSSPGYQWDPFATQKQAGWKSSVSLAETLLARLFPADVSSSSTATMSTGQYQNKLALAVSTALWGNQMDLSLWPVEAGEDATTASASRSYESQLSSNSNDESNSSSNQQHTEINDNLLHNDLNQLVEYCTQLRNRGGGQVDVVVDNAGLELVTDMALAQFLIQSGTAQCVTFHLKFHPTFVSDAMEKDLLDTVDYYANHEFPHCHQAGRVWQSLLATGQWKCRQDRFWVQPYAMWEMPLRLFDDFHQRCDLAFVKGDANYRRLLGDCTWDWTTSSFDDVVGAYFACPVCALRSLKAEIGCGMDAAQAKRAQELDSQWMVNGRFGVIQFAIPPDSKAAATKTTAATTPDTAT